jgi:hypothetical protein
MKLKPNKSSNSDKKAELSILIILGVNAYPWLSLVIPGYHFGVKRLSLVIPGYPWLLRALNRPLDP